MLCLSGLGECGSEDPSGGKTPGRHLEPGCKELRDKRSHLKQKLSGIAHTLLSIYHVLKLIDELSPLLQP